MDSFYLNSLSLRDSTHLRVEPAAAKVILQKSVDAIHGAPQPTPSNNQMVALSADSEAIGPKRFKINRNAKLPQVKIIS